METSGNKMVKRVEELETRVEAARPSEQETVGTRPSTIEVSNTDNPFPTQRVQMDRGGQET